MIDAIMIRGSYEVMIGHDYVRGFPIFLPTGGSGGDP
jgi:hypothetical protein